MIHTKQASLAHLLDDIFSPFGQNPLLTEKSSNYPTASVNIYETADAFHLSLNAPGRKREDFSIQVENGLLHLAYEAPAPTTDPGYKIIRKEFAYRSFKRSFNLDEKINTEGIQAKYEDGVLKLLLPKKETQAPQKQQITIS